MCITHTAPSIEEVSVNVCWRKKERNLLRNSLLSKVFVPLSTEEMFKPVEKFYVFI